MRKSCEIARIQFSAASQLLGACIGLVGMLDSLVVGFSWQGARGVRIFWVRLEFSGFRMSEFGFGVVRRRGQRGVSCVVVACLAGSPV